MWLTYDNDVIAHVRVERQDCHYRLEDGEVVNVRVEAKGEADLLEGFSALDVSQDKGS